MLARLPGPEAAATERTIRIVAFAPHVKTDLMRAARDAGADQVCAAFDHRLPDCSGGSPRPADRPARPRAHQR